MNALELQWLAQLAAMRQDVAEIKLDRHDGQIEGYGHNIVVDDDDFTGENFDIWDIFSESEDDHSSDNTNNEKDQNMFKSSFGWLRNQCVILTSRRHRLDAGQLQDQLYSLLVSDMKSMSSSSPFTPAGHSSNCIQTMNYRCLLSKL